MGNTLFGKNIISTMFQSKLTALISSFEAFLGGAITNIVLCSAHKLIEESD